MQSNLALRAAAEAAPASAELARTRPVRADVELPTSAVEFRRFSFRYPDTDRWALDAVTLRIQPGEFIAVIGPNGSGKSTLCKSLNGVVPHFDGGAVKGSVHIHGADTRTHEVAELAKTVGLVLEDPDAQLFAGTVLDEAAFGPENLGMEPAAIRASVARALRAVGLSGLDERPPMSLSGGQKQRLAIAASLAMTPSVLVFDEATSQLDAEGSEHLMQLVSRLKLRYRLTVFVATHDLGLVRRYADRAIALEGGRVVAFDTPERVLSALASTTATTTTARIERPATAGGPATAGPEAIVIDSLRCEYPGGVVAVDGVSATLSAGRFVGIVGRNGSGKTTLFKSIVGLVTPAAGRVRIGGEDASALGPAELVRRVGYVGQNPDHQLFAETVRREVAFGPTNLRLGRDAIAERVERALAVVGLADHAGEHPLALDRGERSLVALASVLALDPDVLLLDEPTRGQDAAGSRRVMEIACSLRDEGRTVVAIGHDLGLLCEYVDRLIVMDGGRIVADGSVREVVDGMTDVLEAAGVLPVKRPPYGGLPAHAGCPEDELDDLWEEEPICG